MRKKKPTCLCLLDKKKCRTMWADAILMASHTRTRTCCTSYIAHRTSTWLYLCTTEITISLTNNACKCYLKILCVSTFKFYQHTVSQNNGPDGLCEMRALTRLHTYTATATDTDNMYIYSFCHQCTYL